LGPKSIKKSEPKERWHFSGGFGGKKFPNKNEKNSDFEIELERVK